MRTLRDILTADDTKEAVVDDCTRFVNSEVESRRGLSGAGIRAGYKVVRIIQPNISEQTIRILLPEFAAALEPQFVIATQTASVDNEPLGPVFEKLLCKDPAGTANALLDVTDSRIKNASPPVQKAYSRLRGIAQKNVADAVPGLAKTLARHLSATP